jgi:hypothetical protein
MSIIQDARDVLAKWREAVDKEAFEALLDADQDPETGYWDYAKPELGAHLIFGTAGNPELLDAIDRVMAYGEKSGVLEAQSAAQYLAAAVIAANERMSA